MLSVNTGHFENIDILQILQNIGNYANKFLGIVECTCASNEIFLATEDIPGSVEFNGNKRILRNNRGN